MLKWGFIGCGDVVEHKSGKPFNYENKSEVVAVMCRNLNKAKDFAQRHNIKEFYDDADKIIYNENIDAIYIATTPNTHMPYAKKAIEAGKIVYVEKPMGLNIAECEEVIELANEKNIPLFVAYYRRALPFFTHIKKLIDEKEIGEIRTVSLIQYKKKTEQSHAWHRVPEISGGGLFHDIGCHALDILDFLISPIKEVHGFNENQRNLFDCDDSISCSFKFENGVIGTGLWCFDVDCNIDQVEIIGNNGSIKFPVFGNKMTITKNGEPEEIEISHPEFVQQSSIYNVIDSLLGECEALSTGETALRTVKVMEKILNKSSK